MSVDTPAASSRVTPLMAIYLVSALIGLVSTWYFNIQHVMTSDIPFTPATFVASGMTTPMSSSLTCDFLVLTGVALIWMVIEARRLKIPYLAAYLVMTFALAIAFAFPLFLFARERALARQAVH